MRTKNLFSLVASAIYITTATAVPNPIQPRSPVIGGEPMSSLGKFPFIVSITHMFGAAGPSCGGALLTPTMVITARHCIPGLDLTWDTYRVYAGTLDKFKGPESADVEKLVIPPFPADILILQLKKPIRESSTIRYAKIGPAPAPGDQIYTAGWGKTQEMDYSEKLLGISGKVATRRECARLTSHLSQSSHSLGFTNDAVCNAAFCISYGAMGAGSNSGDSGGPIVNARGQLVGIVNASEKKKAFDNHVQHVSMALAPFATWIESVVGKGVVLAGEGIPTSCVIV